MKLSSGAQFGIIILMSRSLLTIFVLVLVFASSFFYLEASATCPVPIAYRIGVLDERFDLSEEDAKVAIADAAAVWENTTGIELFAYSDDPNAFPINFIFDERQRLTDVQSNFLDRLDATESLSDQVRAEHASLVAEYETTEAKYLREEAAYNARLASYNAEVDRYNREGGAPPEAFERLNAEQRALDAELTDLNVLVVELNRLASEINAVGDKGNRLIEVFNEGVNTYNDRFGEAREFTQGDYQGDKINIYQFSDQDELRLVLAHELGHALHIDHVQGPRSIMYYLMDQQSFDLALTTEDIDAFNTVCGDGTVWSKLSFERLLASPAASIE